MLKAASVTGVSITVLAIQSGCTQSPADTWTNLSPMNFGRQEIYATATSDAIYVPGGILVDGSTTASFEMYDVSSDRWVELSPLPEPRHHVSPVVVNGQLYALGGFGGDFPVWVMKSDTFVYDIETDTWSAGTPLPGPRAEHVVVTVGDKIHLIGGRVPTASGGETFDDYIDTAAHSIFDTTIGQWTTGPPAPTRRNSAAAAVIDGKIYVVGGRENRIQDDGSQLQHNLAALEVFDPETNRWESRSPMPVSSGGIAAAALDGILYVFGGEQWTPEQTVFAYAFAYDPANDSWRKVVDLPQARHGLAAATVGSLIYTLGGCTLVGGGAAVGTTESLNPAM